MALKWELLRVVSVRKEPPEPWNAQCGWIPRELVGAGAGEGGWGISWMLHPLGKELESSIASTQKEGWSQKMSSHKLGKEMEREEVAEGWDSPGHREVSGNLATQLSLCLLCVFCVVFK